MLRRIPALRTASGRQCRRWFCRRFSRPWSGSRRQPPSGRAHATCAVWRCPRLLPGCERPYRVCSPFRRVLANRSLQPTRVYQPQHARFSTRDPRDRADSPHGFGWRPSALDLGHRTSLRPDLARPVAGPLLPDLPTPGPRPFTSLVGRTNPQGESGQGCGPDQRSSFPAEFRGRSLDVLFAEGVEAIRGS